MRISAGMKIKNSKRPLTVFGSVGGVVYDNELPVILTCFHCVHVNGMEWSETSPKTDNDVNFMGEKESAGGTIIRCLRDSYIDAAIIDPGNGNIADIQIADWGQLNGIAYPDELTSGSTWLRKIGASTCETYGIYYGIVEELGVPYPGENKPHIFKNLLKVRNPGKTKFAKKGDSGSFVLTGDNRLVGMIVMIDHTYTYLIQAGSIQFNLNIKFSL